MRFGWRPSLVGWMRFEQTHPRPCIEGETIPIVGSLMLIMPTFASKERSASVLLTDWLRISDISWSMVESVEYCFYTFLHSEHPVQGQQTTSRGDKDETPTKGGITVVCSIPLDKRNDLIRCSLLLEHCPLAAFNATNPGSKKRLDSSGITFVHVYMLCY